MFQEQIQKLAQANGVVLPASQNYNLGEYTQWQVDSRNRLKGSMGDYDCSECLNKGVIYIASGNEVVARECRCMAIRNGVRCMRNSGLASIADRYTFDTYTANEPWTAHVKETALKYVDNPQGWLAVLGQVGAGKTHICTATSVAFIRKGYRTKYMMWRDDSVRLKGCVGKEPADYERYIMPLKTAKVLYIDDLFKTEKNKPVSQPDINLAFELLNYRYNNPDLITIISSERTVEDILAIDEAVGSRIYERTKGNCLILSGKDKNWRLK